MGVRQLFKPADIRQRFDEALARIDAAILLNLRYLGEQCVNLARSLDTYKDVTGNLRSSIGYVIVKDGKVVRTDFEPVRRGGNQNKKEGQKRRTRNYGKDGVREGEVLARQLAKNHPTGFALIVVAGMNYASKVESKGKPVLVTAEQYAQTELPVIMKRLAQSINKMAA